MSSVLRFIVVIFAALAVTFLVFFVIAALIDFHIPEQTAQLVLDSNAYSYADSYVNSLANSSAAQLLMIL
ncbi:hypothetical protein AN944_01599 [Shewanella sp. P1-14-1]|uniref:hypothetical protein n=1 Tax=Shewanella sp. P1-14-1 TaxID=1723761 RepID=UPI0006D67B99|nr:hypothetical protein [Shewanella sp. P1-14-1]KPZ71584.1 hypothetical protein AN944_01599 [Shewanella sp. P1-14-1]